MKTIEKPTKADRGSRTAKPARARLRLRVIDTAKIPVLGLVAAKPNHRWTSIEIIRTCDREGVTMTRQALYVAIGDLVDTGFLAVVGGGATPELLHKALSHLSETGRAFPEPLPAPLYQVTRKGHALAALLRMASERPLRASRRRSSSSRPRASILGSALFPVDRVSKPMREAIRETYAMLVPLADTVEIG
jgi:hypothetical protein